MQTFNSSRADMSIKNAGNRAAFLQRATLPDLSHNSRMNSKRKAFIEYIEEIKKVTGLSPTDIGIKAGVDGSTVTRPMSSDEWASKITLKTLSSLAAFSDIQPPESLLADLIPGKTAGPATQKTARGEEMKNALLPRLVAAAMFLSDADMETLIGLAERMSGTPTQHENPTGRGRTS